MTGWVLEADNLRMSFGPTVAVDGVTLRVGAGQAYGLVGPDGAGKTTVMRLLVGLLRKGGGSVRILGRELGAATSEVLQNVGYLAQRFSLYEDMTVRENLAFFGTVRDLRGADIRALR